MRNAKQIWRRTAWKPVPGPLALYARITGSGHFEMMGRLRKCTDVALAARALEDFLCRDLELESLRSKSRFPVTDGEARQGAQPQSRRALGDIPALENGDRPAETQSDRGAA